MGHFVHLDLCFSGMKTAKSGTRYFAAILALSIVHIPDFSGKIKIPEGINPVRYYLHAPGGVNVKSIVGQIRQVTDDNIALCQKLNTN